MTSAVMPILDATESTAGAGGGASAFGRGFGAELLLSAFTTRRDFEYWRANLPAGQVRHDGERNRYFVSPDALLPIGKTAAKYVADQQCRYRRPAGYGNYKEAQRQQWRDEVARDLRYDQFCRDNKRLSPSLESTVREYVKFDSAWLKERNLSCSKSTLYKARRRLEACAEVPPRGRPKGAGKRELHPRAEHIIEQFDYYTHASKAEVLVTAKAFASVEGFPEPTKRQVNERIAASPKGSRLWARQGEGAVDAIAPSGRRPRKNLRGWASMDGRTEDTFVRVPNAGGGWKAIRVTSCGILDPFSWRWLALCHDRTENAALSVRTFRTAAVAYGLPRVLQIDNGAAFAHFTDPDNGGALMQALGVEVVNALPYQPRQKPIESAWNSMKNGLDRFCLDFCGGKPSERPEDLEAWCKLHVMELPTIADLEAWAQEFIEVHNATPREALNGLTPNLHAMQFGVDIIKVDPSIFDAYMSPVTVQRVVGNDGVKYQNILFRPEPELLAKMQGEIVSLRLDPELADRVVLCNLADGAPICYAYADKLAGATAEHVREARRQKQAYKAALKKAIPARDDALLSDTGRIQRVRRDYRVAEQTAMQEKLGITDQRATRIMGTEMAAAARKLKAGERPRVAKPRRGKGAADAAGANGFTYLAEDAATEAAVPAATRPRIDLADLYGGEVADDAATDRGIGFEELYPEAAG